MCFDAAAEVMLLFVLQSASFFPHHLHPSGTKRLREEAFARGKVIYCSTMVLNGLLKCP